MGGKNGEAVMIERSRTQIAVLDLRQGWIGAPEE